MFPNAGAQNGKMSCGGGGGGGSGSAVVFSFLLLCSWFFDFLRLLDAMLMVFLIWFRFCCYDHGFFDVFVQLVRFRCYVHGFFDIFVFLLVCSWVF